MRESGLPRADASAEALHRLSTGEAESAASFPCVLSGDDGNVSCGEAERKDVSLRMQARALTSAGTRKSPNRGRTAAAWPVRDDSGPGAEERRVLTVVYARCAGTRRGGSASASSAFVSMSKDSVRRGGDASCARSVGDCDASEAS